MNYIVRKTGKSWALTRAGSVLGKYSTKGAAILVGRLLAGHAGTVIVARGK